MRWDRASVSQDTIFGANPLPLKALTVSNSIGTLGPDICLNPNQAKADILGAEGEVNYTVAPMQKGDWEAVRSIYQGGCHWQRHLRDGSPRLGDVGQQPFEGMPVGS